MKTNPRARSLRGAAAHRRGQWAEILCVVALLCKGYGIVERRVRGRRGSGTGEIDIVARKGRTIAFIEVKARPSGAEAAASLLLHQRGRLERAAAAFLARHGELAECQPRFDAMLVTPWRWPSHLIDAWRQGG